MKRQFIVSYTIEDTLYLNITNKCDNNCDFCIRKTQTGVGYNLWLEKEPSVSEILQAVKDPTKYKEIVFCGYGEPLSRLQVVKEVAAELKKNGAKTIRINTNGHVTEENVAQELAGLIDIISISLNAQDAETYEKICQPREGQQSYQVLLDFARQCVGVIPRVILSVVEWPGVDVESCEAIAKNVGAEFRLRKLTT